MPRRRPTLHGFDPRVHIPWSLASVRVPRVVLQTHVAHVARARPPARLRSRKDLAVFPQPTRRWRRSRSHVVAFRRPRGTCCVVCKSIVVVWWSISGRIGVRRAAWWTTSWTSFATRGNQACASRASKPNPSPMQRCIATSKRCRWWCCTKTDRRSSACKAPTPTPSPKRWKHWPKPTRLPTSSRTRTCPRPMQTTRRRSTPCANGCVVRTR
mmetsp:Transcript_519/g.1877  ORF Transcript_519/g.1877 Transcript_519/m.1877 type:complete len:212 (+) Transcript_519:1326-1961(+)